MEWNWPAHTKIYNLGLEQGDQQEVAAVLAQGGGQCREEQHRTSVLALKQLLQSLQHHPVLRVQLVLIRGVPTGRRIHDCRGIAPEKFMK